MAKYTPLDGTSGHPLEEGLQVGAPDPEGTSSHAVGGKLPAGNPAPDRGPVNPQERCDLSNGEVLMEVSHRRRYVA